jgi:hypothetical protein
VRRFSILAFFLLMLAAITPNAAPDEATRSSGTLTGVVRDALTRLPVSGATVSAFGRTTTTDERGEFRFKDVPPGITELRIEAPGFAAGRVGNALISAGRVARVQVDLRPEEPLEAELEGIRVQANPFERDAHTTNSATRLDRVEMHDVVGAAWDVQRVFGSQPGASTSSDLTNNLVVRGGNPSENLIRVDDVEVPNVSHITTQGETGGAISLVNLDFVRDAEFTTGGFPASYGGKLSSVLDIRLREGNRERLGGELELSMAGAGGGFEGPLFDGRGSWVASYRKSYLDLLKEPARLTAVPHYDDAHFKAVFDASRTQRLSFYGIAGRSDVDIQWARNTDRAVMDVRKLLTGATWTGVWESAASRVTLSHVADVYQAEVWQSGKPDSVYDNRSREQQTALEAVLDVGDNARRSWHVGANVQRSAFRYRIGSDDWVGYSENEGRLVFLKGHSTIAREEGWRLAGYVHRDQSVSKSLDLKLGVRAQRFTLTDASSVDPRLGVAWRMNENSAFSISGGVYHQSPTYVLLTLDPANRTLDDFRARHVVIGYERRFARSARLLIEAYGKDYDKLPIRENERLSVDNVFQNLGRKRVRGVDALVEKRLEEGVYGSVQLSVSSADARDAQGVWYPDDYDIPIHFIATGGVPVGDSGWRLSGRWDYKAGRPYTLLPIRRNAQGDYELDPDFEDRNTVRYPPYHRLDLRVDRRLDFGGWGASLFLEVENVYDRSNIYAWNFDAPKGKLVGVEQFRRLTIVGIIADF